MLHEQNYPKAEESLQSCLRTLESQNLFGQPTYNFILLRLAAVQRSLHKVTETEGTLESILRNYTALREEFPLQLESAYQTLFRQYMQTNIQKALKLGHYFKKDPQWGSLSPMVQKDTLFMLGVLHI